MFETPRVEVFYEVSSGIDDATMSRVRTNLKTKIRAAGYDPETGTYARNYHPDTGWFVHVVTVFPPVTAVGQEGVDAEGRRCDPAGERGG